MRLLYVPLPPASRALLDQVAARELRTPQNQAAVLLAQALAVHEDDHRPAADERDQARELAEVRR